MLTERERDILEILSSKIRILTREQILCGWWPPSLAAKRNARKRLVQLTDAKLLARVSVLARPLLPLESPVSRWRPGVEAPDFSALSWQLQKRWTEPPKTTIAYLATGRASGIFGGRASGQLGKASQATHDIHLAALYLKLRREAPTLAAGWIGEDILAPTREHQKLPDAVIHDAAGSPRFVYEFGGAYPTDRVEAFHRDCEARSLPYELW